VRTSVGQAFGDVQRVGVITGFDEARAISADGTTLYYHQLVGTTFRIRTVTGPSFRVLVVCTCGKVLSLPTE